MNHSVIWFRTRTRYSCRHTDSACDLEERWAGGEQQRAYGLRWSWCAQTSGCAAYLHEFRAGLRGPEVDDLRVHSRGTKYVCKLVVIIQRNPTPSTPSSFAYLLVIVVEPLHQLEQLALVQAGEP